MILRQPNWAEDLLASQAAASAPSSRESPVVELVMALTDQRLYREVTLSLRQGLRDARAEFSFVRVRGLNALSRFLASSAKSQKTIEHFQDSQSYPDLQVVPVLFEHTLAPRKRASKIPDANAGADALTEVESPPTGVEVALALRVLEGCCLLDSASRTIASQFTAVSELIDFFLAGGPAVQSACLDGLLAIMLDSSTNQKEFERVHGLRKIADMLRNSHLDPGIRLRIAEFVVVLVGQVLPSLNNCSAPGEALKPAWMSKWAHLELVEILGEESAAVVDATMGAVATTFPDAESRQSSTLGFAQQLLQLAS